MARRSSIPLGSGTEWWHGTPGGYVTQGCGCLACKRAWSAYQALWKTEVDPLAPDDPRHGTMNGYANYGCRCDRCKDARRQYVDNRRAKVLADYGVPPLPSDP